LDSQVYPAHSYLGERFSSEKTESLRINVFCVNMRYLPRSDCYHAAVDD
jgi:hypothetical protein